MGDCECMRRRLAAVCGRNCEQCSTYQNGICCGCGYQLGDTPGGECAIFQCCIVQRGLEHCGLCVDFPCQVFVSHAPPLDLAKYYRALSRRVEIGTIAWLEEQKNRG
jgi:hypothetical protein